MLTANVDGRLAPRGGGLLIGLMFCGLLAGCDRVMSTPLNEPLFMRQSQTGFAGETTTTMAVEPDGRFCRSRKLNAKGAAGSQWGHLDEDRLDQLAKAVADLDMATLPDEHGVAAPVNAYRLTLVVGDRQSVFHLRPPAANGKLATDDDPSSAVGRAAAIRLAMTEAIDGAPSEATSEPCALPSD